ncbi:hypothetical protein E4P42_22125 [Mycobacterium sp. PS03-16]|uniref:hypothetical protein n=1 Tax=Mycobacterium sp. PS03-16 TaxID=2559611 RepID=UPI0010733AEF|nr:hypothetical protein [Mycobacterium sp. PS03-16]TFV55666.1 hypothetical protein E4P42_22125 [Mycobacterium sp. PS03-16]
MSGRLSRAWFDLVGPETTPAGSAVALGLGALGVAAAPAVAGRPLSPGRKVALALMAADLWGGAWVNNTRACARWYGRAGQTDGDHLRFAAAHLHPVAVAWLDNAGPQRVPASVWAGAHYVYLMAATVVIRRAGRGRRALGVLATVGGIALDRALGPSAAAPWFAPVFYAKLLSGHAAAALWSREALARPAR